MSSDLDKELANKLMALIKPAVPAGSFVALLIWNPKTGGGICPTNADAGELKRAFRDALDSMGERAKHVPTRRTLHGRMAPRVRR